MRPTLVYIAGPLTTGGARAWDNMVRALEAGARVAALGCSPMLTHWTWAVHHLAPLSHEDWLTLCLRQLEVADCVLRLPGESVGTQLEIDRATELGRPVYDSLEALRAAVRSVES